MPSLLEQIDKKALPKHIAVIMDGNGRWAKKRGLPRTEGHAAGADTIGRLMDASLELGLACVSLYAFSTENWSRPVTEVNALWELLQKFFEEKLPLLKEQNVVVRHSGFTKKLPKSVLKTINKAAEETKTNSGLVMNFCVNYGSRQEIVEAVNSWCKERKEKEKLTEKKLERFLFTDALPDVDLLIRTSGEKRLSNFLLWQCAYAEFIFTDVLWPDFKAGNLYRAILEFQNRTRRFGGL